MRAELEIHWDGSAPGLAEHELSVAALAEPLRLLLRALRRAASDVMMQARRSPRERPARGARGGGKLARGAAALDLRIRGLGHGCLRLDLEVVIPDRALGAQRELDLIPPPVIDQALETLLGEIEGGSHGGPCGSEVQRFLQSLNGVSVQRYTARREGRVLRHVALDGDVSPPTSESCPYLVSFVGRISGVRFAPDQPRVRILASSGRIVSLDATPEQVDEALALRQQGEVRVRAMRERPGGRDRLLSLRLAEAPLPRPPSPEESRRRVLSRWAETLERLAQ